MRDFTFDNKIKQFLLSKELSGLDALIGHRTMEQFALRTLVSLIDLTLDGHVRCEELHEALNFVSLHRLVLERPKKLEQMVQAFENDGAILFGIDSVGNEILMPTPHGMLTGLDEATAEELQLRPIMNELKSRGLVQLSGAIEGPPKWRVTKEGVAAGLDSKTETLANVLSRLCVNRQLIDDAFLSFQASTPMV